MIWRNRMHVALGFLLSACVFCGSVQAQLTAVSAKIPSGTAGETHLPRRNNAYEMALILTSSRYRLCVSDVLSVKFPRAPEFNQTVSIETGGTATFAGAGDVALEGLTIPESVEAIESAYSQVLRDSTAIVELKDFNKPYFLVLGEVNRPGKYDLRGYTSASEALATAGGFKDTANNSHVLLFRRTNNDWYRVDGLDFRSFLSGHSFEQDAEVRAGDMLFVPQNRISKLKRLIP